MAESWRRERWSRCQCWRASWARSWGVIVRGVVVVIVVVVVVVVVVVAVVVGNVVVLVVSSESWSERVCPLQ